MHRTSVERKVVTVSQKIIPNLWFDGNAKEAAEFYVSIFSMAKILSTEYYPDTKEEGLADFQADMAGKELTVEFAIENFRFVAINADSTFRFTPSISFMLNFDPSRYAHAAEYIDRVWDALADGGKVLMPLQEYPFSKRYGWIKDKYGVTWQLILSKPEGELRPFIVPSLLFGASVQNQARGAMEYYISVFQNSRLGMLAPYPEQTGPAVPGAVMFGDCMLENQWFVAMDSGVDQSDTFNEAVSFAVLCKDQAEIDYLWKKLSSYPENEQCGWCKDKFGVSWQIVPENMNELMKTPDAFKIMMNQHKIVIDEYK